MLTEKKVKALGDDVVRSTRKAYRNERIAGALLAVLVIAVVVAVYWDSKGLLDCSSILFHIVNTVFIYTCFASRSIALEAYGVLTH